VNLLNRYLQAVGRLLPKARRDDIIEELRINILAQMEDRAGALGRPLAEDEQVEILRRHGNPTLVAGRYREGNLGLAFGRQLIGPELFPFYKNVLTLNLSITLVIIGIVSLTVGHAAFPGILFPMVAQVSIITLVFALLDRYKGAVLDRWDPRKLPPLKSNTDNYGPNARSIFEFICVALGTIWLALTPQWPYIMLGPGALYLPALALKFWPRWPLFYGAIITLLCAELVLRFFTLFRWLTRRRAQILDLVLRGIGVSIGVLLYLQGPHFVSSTYPEVAEWANLTFGVSLVVAIAIHVWRAGWLLSSLWRERDQMLPARQH
jgi:hypothetical protein